MLRFSNLLKLILPVAAVVVAALLFTGCGPVPQGTVVTTTGSDTMLYLVNTWAEHYREVNPEVAVAVAGGGSGVGITSLLDGTTDICMASREMRETENESAKAKGLTISEHTVALDGLAVIVNPSNSVTEMAKEQLKLVFTGSYKTWSQVGGKDVPIIVQSRESTSGTYAFFMEHVLDNLPYAENARLWPANRTIVDAVAEDEGAVGYVGIGYAISAGDRVKVIAVKPDDGSPAVLPSVETVTSGEYSIARPLHLYTTEPESDAVKAFIDYCLSDEGQRIVAEEDYVPVP